MALGAVVAAQASHSDDSTRHTQYNSKQLQIYKGYGSFLLPEGRPWRGGQGRREGRGRRGGRVMVAPAT